MIDDQYDVVVVGGGAAGLNGALMLARALRSVLVVDAGAPRNASARSVHGLLGHDGLPPAELLARGRDEVGRYGGQVLDGEVQTVSRRDDTFTIGLADGRTVRSRRLLVTTGLADELPDLPGLAERWGRDVLHCPYCHGWEVRGQAIGVLACGPMSLHQALLFRQWSDDVTFFTHRMPEPTDQDALELEARGVRVVTGEVADLVLEEDKITGLQMTDGSTQRCDALVVAPRLRARAEFLQELGLKLAEHAKGVGEHLDADATGRTDVPGVWVAGNVTDLAAQVGASAAAGAMAGAQINADLVDEETRQAVEVLQGRRSQG